MVVSKESWHYRLLDKFSDREIPENLCPYVRRIFAVVIGMIVAGGFLSTLAAGFLACVVCAVVAPIASLLGISVPEPVSLVASAVWVLALCGVVYHSREQARQRAAELRNDPDYEEPEPGLVRSYLRALHDRVCPVIEFGD